MPQISDLPEISLALGIGKSHTVRDLVSLAAAAIERCPIFAKNCCTKCEFCAGALSCCRIQSPSRQFSGRFRRSDSRKLHTFIRYLSHCQSPVIANDCSNFSNQSPRFSMLTVVPSGGSLSAEVLPSLNRRNQSNTCARPIASSPFAGCNN